LIAPLLLLPFLENAFKHGASEQLEKPWLSVEISLDGDVFRCKMLNSKNNHEGVTAGGIGIRNVQKRLEYLYPSKHELKLTDNEFFFMVSLVIHLHQGEKTSKDVRVNEQQIIQNATA
jgi:sensor histidine kinase YesM